MSVSSLEGSPVPVDLATKYQKIAAEYAKIRAQLGVLKKAVVDEQSHSSELKETLRLKDQSLRKAEQEIDSLNFRNQQLTKRVTILQEELDTSHNTSKKGKPKGASREIPNSILAEELQKKISENAQLVSMLQEQTEKHESEKFKLVLNQEMYEHKLEECKKMLVSIEETKLAKLESENKQLLAKLSAKDESLQKLCNEIKVLRNKAGERNAEPVGGDWVNNLTRLLQSLAVEELLRTAITFFRNFEMRYTKCLGDGATSEKLSKCVGEIVAVLTGFINMYSSYSVSLVVGSGGDASSSFEQFNGCVNNYIILLDELALYLVPSKDEEISNIFKDIITEVKNHWVQFQTAVKQCLTCSRVAGDSEECATAFADVFRSLRSTCDYFSSALRDRVRAPDAEDESDKQILSTLSKIGAQSSGLYKKLTENKALIAVAVECRPPKGTGKMATETSASEATEAEESECCQQWKDKYEAINASHMKKIKDLEEQISYLSGAATPRSTHSGNTVQSPVDGKDKFTDITNMFGTLIGPPLAPGAWDDAELTKYFNARANALVADRQMAESKVTALKNECEALQKRLEHSMECRDALEATIKQSQDTVARLQEELTTTTTNYEAQLSSLSEHMANMSDRLAAQEEQIQVLNYQLTEMGGKKGKSK